MTRLSCLALVISAVAHAQVAPDRELEVVRSMFNAGNYKQTLERAQDAMAMANFSDAQRVELHKFAGVAAFNLGEAPVAERHFLQLLQINPDYVLDPFAVPPPVIRSFEEVRRKNADALNLIRQNISLREEQARRDAAEAARRKQQDDAERDRLQRMSAQMRVVEKRPFIVNLVPFGVGQFMQNRTDWGIAFAVTEAVAAVTSIISYFAIEALFSDVTITQHDSFDPNTGSFHDFTYTVHKIPPERAAAHAVWNDIKWISGVAFYAIAAAGIVDAILHHKAEVVTTAPAPAGPSLQFSILPFPGGASGGLTIHF